MGLVRRHALVENISHNAHSVVLCHVETVGDFRHNFVDNIVTRGARRFSVTCRNLIPVPVSILQYRFARLRMQQGNLHNPNHRRRKLETGQRVRHFPRVRKSRPFQNLPVLVKLAQDGNTGHKQAHMYVPGRCTHVLTLKQDRFQQHLQCGASHGPRQALSSTNVLLRGRLHSLHTDASSPYHPYSVHEVAGQLRSIPYARTPGNGRQRLVLLHRQFANQGGSNETPDTCKPFKVLQCVLQDAHFHSVVLVRRKRNASGFRQWYAGLLQDDVQLGGCQKIVGQLPRLPHLRVHIFTLTVVDGTQQVVHAGVLCRCSCIAGFRRISNAGHTNMRAGRHLPPCIHSPVRVGSSGGAFTSNRKSGLHQQPQPSTFTGGRRRTASTAATRTCTVARGGSTTARTCTAATTTITSGANYDSARSSGCRRATRTRPSQRWTGSTSTRTSAVVLNRKEPGLHACQNCLNLDHARLAHGLVQLVTAAIVHHIAMLANVAEYFKALIAPHALESVRH